MGESGGGSVGEKVERLYGREWRWECRGEGGEVVGE